MKNSVLTVALVLLGVCSAVSASSGPHLFGRQFGSCTQCSWVDSLDNCNETDVTCVCDVFASAGSADVGSCASCLQSSDPTIASDISELSQACSTAGSGATGGSGSTATITPAPGGSDSGSDPCATIAACQTVTSVVNACSDDACFCPTALPFLAACASCYQTVNATSASDLLQASSLCSSESFTGVGGASPTPTNGLAFGSCSAACSQIGVAIESCTNDACFCPTLLAAGSGCSACLATVNATEANLLSSGMAGCATEFPSTAAASGSGLNLGSGGATGKGTASNTAAATSKSAAIRGETFVFFSPVHGIMLIAFVAGLLTLYG